MKLIRATDRTVSASLSASRDGSVWWDGTLAGFDVESTGPYPETDRIVSASLIIDKPSETPVITEWLIKPEAKEIALEATAVHGISNEFAMEHGIDVRDALPQMIAALPTDIPMIVVNGNFDFTMLVYEAERYGYDARPVIDKLMIVDTLVCDRYLDMYRPGRRTLTATAAAYGISIRGAHQATGDVLCAIKLARAMGRKYPHFGACDLIALQAVQRSAYKEWAKNYTEYQRLDDYDFEAVKDEWPYRIPLVVE